MAREKTTRTKKTDDSDAEDARLTEPSANDAPQDSRLETIAKETHEDSPPAPQEDLAGNDAGTQDDGAPSTSDTTGTGPGAAPDGTAPEGTDDAQPAETADTVPAPVMRTEQVTVRQGGFWSMLFGGIAAAGIGLLAAPYVLPPDWFRQQGADEAHLIERIAKLEGDLAKLEGPADQGGEIDGLSLAITDLTGQVADLEARVSELAARPVPQAQSGGSPDEAVAALRAQLEAQLAEGADQIDALRVRIDALTAEAEAQEAAARESARATLRRAALVRVRTALDTGEGFAPALADLRATGTEVPEALTAAAGAGVPTRADLVDSFPEAARAALATARREAGEGASMTGFLRAQLGVRSLSPREGNDPDAILSRAEAALAQGRLGDALAEIETLPEGARAALDDWGAQASMRRDALAAAEALSAAMN
ncbi:MAG: COG4223 family protein [Roseovarius sp.]